jgi:hypothetical protein
VSLSTASEREKERLKPLLFCSRRAVASKPIALSTHAQEREIPLAWVEQVIENPVFEEPDEQHPGAICHASPSRWPE